MHLSEAAEILGLSLPATRPDAKKAYSALVKSHKPETDPEGFKRIREAWETLEASFSEEEIPERDARAFAYELVAPAVSRNAPPFGEDQDAPEEGPRHPEEESPIAAEQDEPPDPLWELFGSWMAAVRERETGPREAAFDRLAAAFEDEGVSRSLSAPEIHAWRIAREVHGLWSELLDDEMESCLAIADWAYRSWTYADMPDIPDSMLSARRLELLAERAPTLHADLVRGFEARIMEVAARESGIASRRRRTARRKSRQEVALIVLAVIIGVGIAIMRDDDSAKRAESPRERRSQGVLLEAMQAGLEDGLDATRFDHLYLDELQKARERGDEKEVAAIRLRYFEKLLGKKLKYDPRGMIVDAEEGGTDGHGNDTGN